MTAVWAVDLPISEKFVLLALADNANDEGVCWPSVALLYKKCSMGERTVRRAISKLAELGQLTIHERAGRSHYFTVHPCQRGTPANLAPLPQGQDTPANLAPTPANAAPPDKRSSYLESSSEPSSNRREARAPRSARATRLPADFGLTPERRAVAEAEQADPEREFAQFTDHWLAAAGAKGRKCDWDATWRNWCRRAPGFGARANGTAKTPWVPPITAEEAEARERARGEIP